MSTTARARAGTLNSRWNTTISSSRSGVLSHGANPNAASAAREESVPRVLVRACRARGDHRDGGPAARHGAKHGDVQLVPRSAATAALRLDHEAARAVIAKHPETLRATAPLRPAMQDDRVDVAHCCSTSACPRHRRRSKDRPLHMPPTRTHCTSRSCSSSAAQRSIPSSPTNTPLGAANYRQHPE